jgi:hypothetical protein
MSFPFRAEMVAEYTIFETQQAVQKERLGGKSGLEKIFGMLLLTPTEASDCFALDFISNPPNDKRVEQFCDYLIENYIDADSTLPPSV